MDNPPPIPNKPSDIQGLSGKLRQDALETRHQELLTRQKQLQEQYERLQHMAQQKKGDKNSIPLSSSLVASVSSVGQPQNTAKLSPNNVLIAGPATNVIPNPSSIDSGVGQSSSSLSSSSSSSSSRNSEKVTNASITNHLPTAAMSNVYLKSNDSALKDKNVLSTKKSVLNIASPISALSARKISTSSDVDRGNLGSSGNETEESSNPEEDNSEATPSYKKHSEVALAKSTSSNKTLSTSSSVQIVKVT